MKVKTADLKGAALRWGVACATQKEMPSPQQFKLWGDFKPDCNWSQGGPLFEKHAIEVRNEEDDNLDGWWIVEAYIVYANDIHNGTGRDKESKLIAFCRALVAAKLGDEVEIPDDLSR